MDLEAIDAREQELRALQSEQRERLARARQEQAEAAQSLDRIEGALLDVAYWRQRMQESEQARLLSEQAAYLANGAE